MEPIFGEEEADDPDRFKIATNSVQKKAKPFRTQIGLQSRIKLIFA